MKYQLTCLMIGATFLASFTPVQKEKTNSKSDIDQKVEALLAKMTLEEKAGQMTQVTLDVVSKGGMYDAKKEQDIDAAKLDTAILKYKLGSILNTGVYPLTREKWYDIMTKIQVANEKSRLKIPVLYGIDAIHGVNYTREATLFPQELAMAATWNPSLIEKGASITAYETRASAIPWTFSPVLDLGRQPLWSRFFETYGEDSYLVTQMGKAAIRGFQGNDIGNPEKISACLKHFYGYSASTSGKDRTPILLNERDLREIYLPPFAAAIKEGAMTVMINSSEIAGTPVHASYHVLTEVLKGELKFQGFAVTDWEDIIFLHNAHHVATSYKDAVRIAINAGIDMSMVPSDFKFTEYLIQLVNEKQIPMSRIDDAVRRILKVKYKLGLFNKMFYPLDQYPKFGSAEHADASYQAALECLTLLKNGDNILPLNKQDKYLVTGIGANSLNYLNGGWTHTWQGIETKYNTKGKKTTLEAIKEKIGEGNVKYIEGAGYDKDINTAKAVEMAADVKAIIVCLGENQSVEKPGDIEDLEMPEAQLNLVRELAKTGKPIVLVLTENRPRLIGKIEKLAAGILMAYLPGNEGGRAIAEVLFGDFNPCGKLPFTYPRTSGSIYHYDHKYTEEKDAFFGMNGFNPQFKFGTGLSYTSFEYDDLKVNPTLKGNDTLKISVKITNTGKIAGKEVAQLYVKDEVASITPPVKRLKGFQKISLNPGESKIVEFKITRTELAFVNEKLQWITEPGTFKIMVGNTSEKITYSDK
jgi:beta-glucosidase